MDSKFNQERRNLLKTSCVLAGATAVVTIGGSLPAFADPQKDAPQVGDVFVYSDGPKKGTEVMAADVVLNAKPILVSPKSASGEVRDGDNFLTLLYRVDKSKLPADMVGDTIDGLTAYSAICTHQGCTMTDIHMPNEVNNTFGIICPCHDAVFDPLQEGKNVGGAASATLAYFPIKSDGGKIVVKDLPSAHVGIRRADSL